MVSPIQNHSFHVPYIFKVLGGVSLVALRALSGLTSVNSAPVPGHTFSDLTRRENCLPYFVEGPEFELTNATGVASQKLLALDGNKTLSTRWIKINSSSLGKITTEVTNFDGSVDIATFRTDSTLYSQNPVSVSAARFGDGRIAICYTGAGSFPECAIYTSDGATLLQYFFIFDFGSGNDDSFLNVVPLMNGNILLAQNGSYIRGIEIDSDGNTIPNTMFEIPAGDPFTFALSPITAFEFPSGLRAAPAARPAASGGNNILVPIFQSDGTEIANSPFTITSTTKAKTNVEHKNLIGRDTLILAWVGEDNIARLTNITDTGSFTTTDLGEASTVDIVGTHDENLAVVFLEKGTDIYAKVIELNAITPLTCSVIVNDVTAGNQTLPASALLSNGHLRVAWKDETGVHAKNLRLNSSPKVNSVIPTQNVTIGNSFDISLDLFSDNDGHAMTLSVVEDGQSTLPAGCTFNASTKTLTCNFPQLYPKGITTFRVSADDGYYNGIVDYTFEVNVVNRQVQITDSPTLTGFVGTDVTLDLEAWINTNAVIDLDGDPISVASVANLPSGFTFNSGDNTISGTVATGMNEQTFSDIVVTLTDGIDTVTANIPVNFPNRPPVPPTIGTQTVKAKDFFSYTLPIGTDPDNDSPITLTVLDLPPNFSYSSGTITGTPTRDDVGSYTVRVIATDPSGATAETTFALEVEDIPSESTSQSFNTPPLWSGTSFPQIKVVAGHSKSFSFDQNDVSDNGGFDNLWFYFPNSAPSGDGVSLNGQTISISPLPGRSNTNTLTLRAADINGLYDTISVPYRVYSEAEAKPFRARPLLNQSPIIGKKLTSGDIFISETTFASPVDNPINLIVTLNPSNSWANVKEDSSLGGFWIEGTPNETPVEVTVTAQDSLITSLTTSESFTIAPVQGGGGGSTDTGAIAGATVAGAVVVGLGVLGYVNKDKIKEWRKGKNEGRELNSM